MYVSSKDISRIIYNKIEKNSDLDHKAVRLIFVYTLSSRLAQSILSCHYHLFQG